MSSTDPVGFDGRIEALTQALLGCHTLLHIQDAQFVSLIDPPPHAGAAAAACVNEHTWPVLAGAEGARDIMLSAPIILYDYPAVAPESAHSFFDATEIDELLALRVMPMTDEERREASATDDRAWTASGRSRASSEIRIFVNVPRAPSAPTGLLGLADGSSLALSWTNTSTGGAPTSLLLDVSGSVSASVPLSLGETFSFVGVPSGTYTFTVRAVNSGGTSAVSSAVTLTIPSGCPGPPQAPENFVVSRAGSVVSVAWDPPSSGPAVTGYVLRAAGRLNEAVPLNVRPSAAIFRLAPTTYQ